MRNSRHCTKRHRNAWGLSRAATRSVRRMRAESFGSGCDGAMRGNALIDTGAILALLDRRDRWHDVCADAFRQLRLPLVTSEAVLTELFHLVGDSRVEMEAAWKFVLTGAIVMAPIEDSELRSVYALMSRYWDRPMDFADATLGYLAKRESLPTRLSGDHAECEIVRMEGKRR